MIENVVDAVIIGAGVAGLTAMRELDRAGLNVLCLEARHRIGGRIDTLHDPLSPLPVELGAEFSHGHAPEIFDIAKSAKLCIHDVAFNPVHIGPGGQVQSDNDDSSEKADQLMDDLVRTANPVNDQSFSEWVEQTSYSEKIKQRAASFVEGFNAARKEVISVASLALDTRASEQIGADQQNYRLMNGYDALPRHILNTIHQVERKLRLSRIVERIEWKPGAAVVHTRSALTGDIDAIHCRKVIVTVPLGVLQTAPGEKGAIRFDPPPASILDAAKRLCFGQVIRVVLRFREAFWESSPPLSDASFLFSQEPLFPTWWTTLPARTSLIIGWSAGPHADELLGKSEPEILEAALASLSRITQCDRTQLGTLLEAAYFHDWHNDPFARGAYSYVPAGALQAREVLATPVAGTLYFAGEATETTGHSGTVNGAIATGLRAATQVLQSLPLKPNPATSS